MAELDDYRGPNVAVDVAVFTVDGDYLRGEGHLAVLIQNRVSKPRGKVLPGRFLREGERVGDGLRAAMHKVGIEVGPIQAALDHHVAASDSTDPIRAHLIGVFDTPGRDPRSTWSLSLAHYLVLPRDQLTAAKGELVAVEGDGSIEPDLLFDHLEIVQEAVRNLRDRYEIAPDPDNLLTDREITLPDLQAVHQAVLGEPLRTDTFRRRMEALLKEAVDPADPRKNKTRPSGLRGGPPTRLWERYVPSGGLPTESQRRLRLPRKT